MYDLLQEFLKGKQTLRRKESELMVILARWHIALVQEPRAEENNPETTPVTVGMITLEDVIEEMLQREIIEETDLFSKFLFVSEEEEERLIFS